jgi:hypothetical protein
MLGPRICYCWIGVSPNGKYAVIGLLMIWQICARGRAACAMGTRAGHQVVDVGFVVVADRAVVPGIFGLLS